MNRLACPKCLSPNHLGENVEGWRTADRVYLVDGKVTVDQREPHVYDAERTDFFCANQGCNPDARIPERRLVQIDRDGKPVLPQPAAQGCLDLPVSDEAA